MDKSRDGAKHPTLHRAAPQKNPAHVNSETEEPCTRHTTGSLHVDPYLLLKHAPCFPAPSSRGCSPLYQLLLLRCCLSFRAQLTRHFPLPGKQMQLCLFLSFSKFVLRMGVILVTRHSTSGQDRGSHSLRPYRDFPGGAVVKNPPANAADKGLIPGLGRSHMLRSN